MRFKTYKVILRWKDQKLDICKRLYPQSSKGTENICILKSGLKYRQLVNQVITDLTSQQRMLRWPQEVTALPRRWDRGGEEPPWHWQLRPCPGLCDGSGDPRADGVMAGRAAWGQEVGKGQSSVPSPHSSPSSSRLLPLPPLGRSSLQGRRRITEREILLPSWRGHAAQRGLLRDPSPPLLQK